MIFYGIATAITGDSSYPRFHCNVLKLDSAKITPRKRALRGLSQPRIIEQVRFEPVQDLCFTTGPTNINDSNVLQEVAKKFLTVLTEVTRLQKQTEFPDTKVSIAIGDEKARAPYPIGLLIKAFIQVNPTAVKDLLQRCQFQLNSYSREDNSSMTDNPAPGKNDPLVFYSEKFLELINRKNLKSRVKCRRAQPIIKNLKNSLLKILTLAKASGLGINIDQRFVYFESAGFEPLGQHPSLKRALIEAVRKVFSIGPQHIHIKTDKEKRPPFIDVLKTLLLDKYSERYDDGIVRFDTDDNNLVSNTINKFIS